jgi:hypothetical protein
MTAGDFANLNQIFGAYFRLVVAPDSVISLPKPPA